MTDPIIKLIEAKAAEIKAANATKTEIAVATE